MRLHASEHPLRLIHSTVLDAQQQVHNVTDNAHCSMRIYYGIKTLNTVNGLLWHATAVWCVMLCCVVLCFARRESKPKARVLMKS